MTGPTKQSERHVEAVLAALDVLDCFLTEDSLSIKDLMDRTGFSRNRVMRLSGTLLYKGYLLQDSKSGAYLPGPKLMALGKAFERKQNVVALVRPILLSLALGTGESASLYVREGLERVVLARGEGTQAIRYTVTEGQRMELHAGAGGKVLLAYAPREVLDAVIKDSGLAKRTSRTISDPDILKRELKKVRKQGYAASQGERISDSCAIAAPVFDIEENLVGVLGIAGPESRFTAGMFEDYLKQLLDAAQKLSRQLGWRG